VKKDVAVQNVPKDKKHEGGIAAKVKAESDRKAPPTEHRESSGLEKGEVPPTVIQISLIQEMCLLNQRTSPREREALP